MTKANEEATFPGAYAREIITLSGRLGVTPEPLLEGLGMSLAELEKPQTRLGLEPLTRLVLRTIELTGEPGLAFYMGLHMRLSWHGFLGFAAMTAKNVREALSLAERFSRTRTTAISLRVAQEGEIGSLTLEENVDLGALRPHLVIALFTGIGEIAYAVTGQRLRGTVDLSFPEPAHFERFEHLVPGTVRFERPASRILFESAFFDVPFVTADPVAMQLAREQCERELATLGEGVRLLDQVRALLREQAEGVPTIDEVAKRLHVSTRTLKRKLADHGTTYTDVVDAYLRHRALLLIDDPRLTIDEIAGRLGYSDAANFTRAFRRWTGSTPGAFRGRGDRS